MQHQISNGRNIFTLKVLERLIDEDRSFRKDIITAIVPMTRRRAHSLDLFYNNFFSFPEHSTIFCLCTAYMCLNVCVQKY